jgi:hypothetical protein
MRNILLTLGLLVIGSLIAVGSYQAYYVNKAHLTFTNYYAFRGCEKLISKTDTSAICETNTGQTIKIVSYENKWYLDGDLPCPNPGLRVAYIECVI